jgi:hypothetical protein
VPLNVGVPSLMVNLAGMSDDVGGDLTRDEVRSVIETFWRLTPTRRTWRISCRSWTTSS